MEGVLRLEIIQMEKPPVPLLIDADAGESHLQGQGEQVEGIRPTYRYINGPTGIVRPPSGVALRIVLDRFFGCLLYTSPSPRD